MPGLMSPTASRSVDRQDGAGDAARRCATRASLPPSFVPSALSEIVVLSDFWSPIAEIKTMLAGLSAAGAHGTLVQVVDPAEEIFPYSGRIEFVEPEVAVITAGRAREMGERLYRTRSRASRRNPHRAGKLDWSVLDPHHRPLGRRTVAVPACGMMVNRRQRCDHDRQSGARPA